MSDAIVENAQGRLNSGEPVAIIDIGSNSVRQVIYEGLTRAPSVLFNEKVLCGLGRGLVISGRMEEIAIERAIKAIRRFKALSQQVGVSKTFILATAAVRDAANGNDLVQPVEEICDTEVNILSGEQEAKYAALGITSGFDKPRGIVGDIGGGSLELAIVGNGVTPGETLPLGGLKIRDLSDGDLDKAREITKTHLANAHTDWHGKSRNFYAIGGTWRSLAKLHLSHNNYPLPVIHHYQVTADQFVDFCENVIESDIEEIAGISSVSKNRRSLLQFGAVVLSETLQHFGAENVLMSSLGVREGYLYSQLDQDIKQRDVLLDATWDMAILRARSPGHSAELADWTEQICKVVGIDENKDERRYRIAACYLADIGWRAHPDYRATQSLGIIANAGFVGLSHEGRAFISMANYYRYKGLGAKIKAPKIANLASERTQKNARLLAGMFRLGYLYSASTPGILPRITFKTIGDIIEMRLPQEISDLSGERPDLRLRQLAREADRQIELKII